jgi:uncharacterized protein involved in outer membrane biogenesis
MTWVRKWWRLTLGLVALVIATQIGVSLFARTRRVHNYLVRHLEQSFGRTVEVRHFTVLLLPRPLLEAEQITVGEDPAFGREYFLRADRLTAGLRWSGLLRGHFEFGTLSLTRPSLILARNDQGSWNLERWLPPAKHTAADDVRVYGPQQVPTAANRLQKIDIDDGRLNFKIGDEKLPFAFLGVSGTVEQVSSGRWQLQLEAQPWRSGVTLQSTGTLSVRGDVAGTSARLQPAQVTAHWEKVSLADLARLFRGEDYGLRGVFAVDATAKSAVPGQGPPPAKLGDWNFSLQARAAEIHRWDLTERSDNPALNLKLDGRWNVAAGTLAADRFVVETAKSNLRGSAHASSSASPAWEVRVDSAGVQATDLLAWYRAFHAGVDDKLAADQFFTGAMTVHGWPLELQDAAFSSNGGELRVPGINSVLRVSAFAGGRQRGKLTTDSVRVSYGAPIRLESASGALPAKRRSPPEGKSAVDIGFTHDFEQHSGSITVDGRVERIEDVLRTASALGFRLNHGWELTGTANAALHWDYNNAGSPRGRWNGRLDLTKGVLQAAGLNQSLQLSKARLEWRDGLRATDLGQTTGFGAEWAGQITQISLADADSPSKWTFQLHADHLDAADLDRWIGPRARPNWLQRLLPPLLGGNKPNAAASELVRRINAEGELRIDEFTLEKLKFSQVRAHGGLRDLRLELRDAQAHWASGEVRAKLRATFLPHPAYDVAAELNHIDLAQLPASGPPPERFAGLASGILHLMTQGVGRDELLQHLAGKGDLRLSNVEFRGWDVSASVADGEPRPGASRWSAGEAAFAVRDRGIVLSGLRLDAGAEKTLVKGTVSFSQDADLTVQTLSSAPRETSASDQRHVLKISGPLDLPRVSVEKLIARQPAD